MYEIKEVVNYLVEKVNINVLINLSVLNILLYLLKTDEL